MADSNHITLVTVNTSTNRKLTLSTKKTATLTKLNGMDIGEGRLNIVKMYLKLFDLSSFFLFVEFIMSSIFDAFQ